MASSTPLVWVITGTSSGIGRELALAALRRGEKVIATTRARSMPQLDDLKAQGASILELDVTAPLNDLHKVAEKAIAFYGHVDILVNNAGAFLACGATEEISPEDTFSQFNLNLFGSLNVARAFLPHMRKRRTGKVIWIGSLTGWQPTPALSMYAAVKHAMRGISETMDIEVAPLGLRSINIEPGYFRSKLIDPNNRTIYHNTITDYKESMEGMDAIFKSLDGTQPGDSAKLGEAIVDIVKGQGLAAGKTLPRSLQLGDDCYEAVKKELTDRLQVLEEWKEVTTGLNVSK